MTLPAVYFLDVLVHAFCTQVQAERLMNVSIEVFLISSTTANKERFKN
jgi:hypothetical protein